MICKDCEMEVEKTNKNGICVKCASRKNQIKYLNKRNGTNTDYIPLKELKNIDIDSYNKIINKRKAQEIEKIENTQVKELENNYINDNKSSDEELKNIYYSKAATDIKQAFEEKGISQDYLNYKDLNSWIELFYTLLQEENFIADAKRGEDIFNKLKDLYQHARENLSWNELDKVNDIACTEKALLELRRPTKNILDYYITIEPLISYLKQDDNFMNMVKEIRSKMQLKTKAHEEPFYISNVNSNIIQDSKKFKYEPNSRRTKIYDCTVWCYNLNGDPNRNLFRAKGGIYARNISDARMKFKAFLSEYFASVTYKEKDISIIEINSQDEIKKINN